MSMWRRKYSSRRKIVEVVTFSPAEMAGFSMKTWASSLYVCLFLACTANAQVPTEPAIPVQTTSVTLDRIFQVNYTQLNINMPNLQQVIPGMCKSTKTQYRLKLQSVDHPDVYRVPHSRIFEEGHRCGNRDDDYPDAKLWIEPHMTLAPFHLIRTNTTAEAAGILAFHVAFNAHFRTHMTQVAPQLEEEVRDGDLWVGWEQLPRVCNERTILNSGSFVLFGRTDDDSVGAIQTPIEIPMVDPATGVEYNRNRTTFSYYKEDDIHLTFYEVLAQKIDSHDLICPSQNEAFDTAAAIAAAEDRSTENEASCFPSSATVQMESGVTKRMDSLAIGDRVHVGNGQYASIFMFTHKMSGTISPFVVFQTESGASLSLTKGHYVYANDRLVAAGHVAIGDLLSLGDGSYSKVVTIDLKLDKGLYNPQTENGDIVVNGVLSSTFTTAVEPSLAHAALAPLRFLSRFGLSVTVVESGAQSIVGLLPRGSLVL